MRTVLFLALAAILLAVIVTLILGVMGMARSSTGADAHARSNRLMRWRVGLQGAALLLFALAMLTIKQQTAAP